MTAPIQPPTDADMQLDAQRTYGITQALPSVANNMLASWIRRAEAERLAKEAAQKACAEMRDALELAWRFTTGEESIVVEDDSANAEGETFAMINAKVRAALSLIAGKPLVVTEQAMRHALAADGVRDIDMQITVMRALGSSVTGLDGVKRRLASADEPHAGE